MSNELSEGFVCVKCGTHNPADVLQCPNCGASKPRDEMPGPPATGTLTPPGTGISSLGVRGRRVSPMLMLSLFLILVALLAGLVWLLVYIIRVNRAGP